LGAAFQTLDRWLGRFLGDLNVKREVANATQTTNALQVLQDRQAKLDPMECPAKGVSQENQAAMGPPWSIRILKAVVNVPQEHLDPLETPDPRVQPDQKDQLDRQRPAAEDEENRDRQALQVHPENLDLAEAQVRKAHLDGMEPAGKDAQGRRDPRDHLEPLDNLDPRDLLEVEAALDPVDPRVHQGNPEIRDRLVSLELLDKLGLLETTPNTVHVLLAVLFVKNSNFFKRKEKK